MKFMLKLFFIFLLSLIFSTQAKSDFNEDEDLFCLSLGMYFEARGEGYVGMRAVGHAIINRAYNRDQTICETVFQPSNNDNYRACSFSFYCDGKPEVIANEKVWNRSYQIAFGLLNGWYPFSSVGNADHYLVCKLKDKVYWARRMKYVGRVGSHCFFDSKE